MRNENRYNRQKILAEIGTRGQQKISAARVLVIGVGGLGCPALLYLAAAGVGTIGIVDFDHIDESNLQRQVLFNTGDQGHSKALKAKERLSAINPGITIFAYNEELTEKNVISLFSGYDIIIDGTDNFSAKFLISDAAVKLGKSVVYAAIQGFEGQVSIFNHEGGPCYRCLHPQPPQAHIMNCAEAGVIGALAGIIGAMQAMETIKIIVANEGFQTLAGRLWMVDTRTMEVNILNIPRRKDCPVCSRSSAEITPHYASPVCATGQLTEISCIQAKNLRDAAFIDVREREEWDTGHIENARHLPLSALRADPGLFGALAAANDRPFILYCQHGRRSLMAAEILRNAGFPSLYSMTGGYEAWQKQKAQAEV